jgi:hypothetical protein
LHQKQLLEHLTYAYLGENKTLLVVVAANLNLGEEEKLLRVLREHKTAIGWTIADIKGISNANQGVGHANHTCGNGAEFTQDPLSLPIGPITSGAEFPHDPLSLPGGPIVRLRAKRFKEALNGLIQENGVDSKKTKMGSNNNQGLVHVIKTIDEVN